MLVVNIFHRAPSLNQFTESVVRTILSSSFTFVTGEGDPAYKSPLPTTVAVSGMYSGTSLQWTSCEHKFCPLLREVVHSRRFVLDQTS